MLEPITLMNSPTNTGSKNLKHGVSDLRRILQANGVDIG
jgi:hypothetical protein